MGDDYLWWLILQGREPYAGTLPPIAHIYNFIPGGVEPEVLRGTGLVTWWAAPDLRIALARPLAAATMVVDHALFPDTFWLQHLHGLAWYAVAVALVALLFRRVLEPAVAGLAGLLFAVEDAHAMNAAWIANRHALIALVFGALGFLAHLRWRRSERRAWGAAALVLAGIGLLAGEAALGALAWIAAWQLTLARPGRRLAPLLPYVGLVAAWRFCYDALGYGIIGSGLYIDPRHDPVAFALALVERFPQLMLGQWLGAPVDAFPFSPAGLRWAAVVAGVLVLAVLAWLALPLLRSDPRARFLAVAMGLATVPLAAAFPMDRLLIFAGVGASGLLALLAREAGWLGHGPTSAGGSSAPLGAWLLAREAGWLGHGPTTTWGRRVLVGALMVLHLPVSALLLAGRCAGIGVFGVFFGSGAATAPADPEVAQQTFLWVTGQEFPVAYTPVVRLAQGRPAPARTALLASFAADNRASREDVDTLVIAPEGGFVQVASDHLERQGGTRSAVGDTVEMPDFVVEVRQVTSDGRPAVAAFHFRRPLEDRSYRWLQWSEGGAVPFVPPEEDSTVVIPALPLSALFPPGVSP